MHLLHILFFIPIVRQKISYYDTFLNYDDINKILNEYNFDINDLNNDDIVNVTGSSCYDASDGTDPLTAIRFFFSSGNFASGSTITMYGIKIS